MKRTKKWYCMDCKCDTRYEHYFVYTELWLSVVRSKQGMLCIQCLERRLGRTLTKNDFTDAYINRLTYGIKSDTLVKRLTT